MIRTDRARIRPSRGERLRSLALALVALAGAVLCLASVGTLDPSRAGPAGTGATLWRLMAGALGGFVALRFNLDRFGWLHLRGWARMAGGSLLVTLFAPVVAGSLILPLYGTMFGPFALILTLIRHPVLALVWLGTLLAAHLLLQDHRRERATIFMEHPPRSGWR